MGNGIAVSPDGTEIAFSYFLNGDEAIYNADIDGTNIERVTDPSGERHHNPQYSYDGRQILYLEENSEGIQALISANKDGSEPKQLSDDSSHVSQAIFSPIGNDVYYIAMPAKDLNKLEGESKEGFDLFTVGTNGEGNQKLTDKDHFTMNSLSISPNGEQVFYSLFGDNQDILYVYSPENGSEKMSELASKIPSKASYSYTLSPSGEKVAFTAVSEESENSSLYEYELFLTDLENVRTRKLTSLKASVESPVFYNEETRIAFLEHRNWPSDPEEYHLRTMNLETEKLEEISLDMPKPQGVNWFAKALYFAVNGWTIAILYVVLLCVLIAYTHFQVRKTFLPAFVSIGLAVFVFASSFVVAGFSNPWYGIGVAMLALGIMACTIVALIFAYVMKRFVKNS